MSLDIYDGTGIVLVVVVVFYAQRTKKSLSIEVYHGVVVGFAVL